MKSYNPLNWYWIVNNDASNVYSSAIGDYVAVSNVTYQAWIADGTVPTVIDTEDNLGGVLSAYYPDITRPIVAGVLSGYQQEQANDIFKHKLIKYLFVLHNDVRVLKGQQPHTVAQARAFFKGLM